MQKVTYVLLQRHANSYWQTERDDEIRSGLSLYIVISVRHKKTYSFIVVSPAKRRRRPVTICSFSNGKEPLPGLKNMMSKLAQQDKLVPPMSPGIQHHTTPTQPLSRLPSNTPLRPVTPDITLAVPPPPVPPKPNVVRTDQMYDDYQQKNPWQAVPNNNNNSQRQAMWYVANIYIYINRLTFSFLGDLPWLVSLIIITLVIHPIHLTHKIMHFIHLTTNLTIHNNT